MINSIFLVLPLLASFLVVVFLMPFWIRKARQINLMWENMNQLNSQKIAGSGGIVMIIGFVLGLLLFVAHSVFFLNSNEHLVEIFAMLSVLLILCGIGLLDDLLGWRKGGLSKRSRIILVAFAAIPLIVLKVGKSIINIPLIGPIDTGLLYALVIIPIGIVGATTTFNFLAGFNGLESGQGIIIFSALALVSLFTGSTWLFWIILIMIASLLAFFLFNNFPARVLPGDSLTYSVGGMIAIIAILGNFEKIAIFFFIPYALETILKLRGKLSKQSFGKPQKDGTLDMLYSKIYGLEHLAIYLLNKTKWKATEQRVVMLIWSFQILIIIIGFIIFRQGIFT